MIARTVFLFVVLLIIAADKPAEDTKKDFDKLQGEWTMVSMETKGKKSPVEGIKQYKLTIKGDQWTVAPGDGREIKATIKLDPSKNPKMIDLVFEESGRKYLSRGIYKLEGDTLTLCRTRGAIPRPRQLKTTERAGLLVVWKKQTSPASGSRKE